MGTRWGRSEHPAFGLEDSPERRDQDPEDDDDPGVVPIIEPLRFVLDAIKPEDSSAGVPKLDRRGAGFGHPCRPCDQAQVQGKRVEVEAGMRIAEA